MDRAKIIGSHIKHLRKQAKITQSELADGIGTQAQISKIENGEVIPLCTTLYEIAVKLGVEVNYFYNQAYIPRVDYINEVKYQIRKAIRERNYNEVDEIIRNEEHNIAFKIPSNHQFIIWHKGITEFYVRKDTRKALGLLEDAFKLGKGNKNIFPLSLQDIEILISQAIINTEIMNYEKSIEIYQSAINYLKYIPEITDMRVVIRLYYNLAQSLFKVEAFNDAISYCEKGIKICLKEELLYLLGELHYEAGESYQALNHTEESLKYYLHAREVYIIEGKTKFAEITEEQIKGLRSSHIK